MDTPVGQFFEIVFGLAAIGLVIALGRHFLVGPSNLRIVIKSGQVDVSGRALTGRRSQVSDFVKNNLPEVHHARVEGYWDGRRLRLHFKGDLSPGDRQRVRNFLLTIC